MSLSTIIETMDTPMVDFNEDSDIPMGASNENWFLPVSRMDEDGLMAQENYSHTESLEVDMVEYEEMAEYDMDEEVVDQGEQNLVDTDVLDVSFHSSPIPPVPQELGQIHPLDITPIVAPVEISEPQLGEHIAQATVTQEIVETVETTEIASLPTSDGTIVHKIDITHPDEQQISDSVIDSKRQEEPLSETLNNSTAEGDVGSTNDSHLDRTLSQDEVSESVLLVGYAVPTEEDYATKPVDSSTSEDPSLGEPPVEHAEPDHDIPTTVALKSDQEVPTVDVNTSIHPHSVEQTAPSDEYRNESHTTEPTEAEAQHYHELSGEEQFNSPPIHLKLNVRSSEGDQPDFALFSTPDLPHDGEQPPEEPLVLLQHHQELFYEPISAVFDAFRNEEYFNHLEELSNAEMSISAPDLQLLVSEDNIYAREVSLHDLVAMHQGLGLHGHLRLTLQSVVPRFITRYNQLREQITRLAIDDGGANHGHQVADHQDTNPSHEQASLPIETKIPLAVSGSSNVDVSNQDGLANQPGESTAHASESTVEDAKGPDDDRDANEEALGQSEEIVEHAGVKDHDDAPYEDEFGDDDAEEKEEDYRDELDADRIHDGNDDAREEDREEDHATEYNDEVASEEDDEEGYEGEFGENGNDGVGTVADNFDGTIPEDDSAETSSAEDGIDEADYTRPSELQAQALSHSTSAASHSTEVSNATSEESIVIVSEELLDPTDDPSQEISELVNEGKIGEENDEFGDEDFGEDDFNEDAATEDTLEESPDENAEELDTASQAIFAESEKFTAEHGAGVPTNDIVTDIATDSLLGFDKTLLRTPVSKTTATKGDEFVIVHKNSSKRSLEEADLEEENLPSPPSSPGSKRARVL